MAIRKYIGIGSVTLALAAGGAEAWVVADSVVLTISANECSADIKMGGPTTSIACKPYHHVSNPDVGISTCSCTGIPRANAGAVKAGTLTSPGLVCNIGADAGIRGFGTFSVETDTVNMVLHCFGDSV